MLILKEDEFYQVEEFCSFFNGDYNKVLSSIEELVKQGYLEKIELQRKNRTTKKKKRIYSCFC